VAKVCKAARQAATDKPGTAAGKELAALDQQVQSVVLMSLTWDIVWPAVHRLLDCVEVDSRRVRQHVLGSDDGRPALAGFEHQT
jgi:hypothetical protein